MIVSKRLRFALGILRHPGQAGPRLRELFRIAAEPPISKAINTNEKVQVKLIFVDATESLKSDLVDMYRRNPSPFVVGPKTRKELQRDLDKGFKYYLVRNSSGKTVGARAFDPKLSMLIGTVTDFDARGRGYQLHAGKMLRERLANEGVKEFRAVVIRTNTRIQRAMIAEGWKLEPHPSKPEMLRGTLVAGDDR
ncbi:MAG: hypothetical protein DRR42_27010 [Gammaproteobacteria bacterium]|nr:MAG: hypothetical protein DRR42_27010 [Gammaproteobacteria bacterium]